MTSAVATAPQKKAKKEKALANKPKIVDLVGPMEMGQMQILDMRKIKSNAKNPRESAPKLADFGHGVFVQIPGSDKLPIVELALSDDVKNREEFVKLIRKHEPGIVETAMNLRKIGLQQPIKVRPKADSDDLDLVFGCRRFLATLFNYADTWEGKDPSKYKLEIPGIVQDMNDDQAELISFSENIMRMDMNPMEQARIFARMKEIAKLDIKGIAEYVGMDHQTVRTRLQLNRLKPDLQKKVETKELGVVKALKLAEGKADPSVPKNVGKGSNGQNNRKRVPTLKEFQNIYETREPDETYSEAVRMWIALEVLGAKYMKFKELKKMIEEQNKKDK